MVVFDSTGKNEQGMFLKNLFIDQNPHSFSYNFNPSLVVGDYVLALYETSTSPYTQMTDGVKFSVVDATGINDDITNNTSELIVYPTPAVDYINVVVADGMERIKVYDMQGALLIDQPATMGVSQQLLKVADLPAGSYLLTVHSGNKILSQKFLKK